MAVHALSFPNWAKIDFFGLDFLAAALKGVGPVRQKYIQNVQTPYSSVRCSLFSGEIRRAITGLVEQGQCRIGISLSKRSERRVLGLGVPSVRLRNAYITMPVYASTSNPLQSRINLN